MKIKNRSSSIDQIKGIMIIFVVFGHIIYMGDFKLIFEDFHDLIYIFHMPVFLMLSGYFFRCELNRKWLKGILSRLIVPYVISFSLYLVVLYFVGLWEGVVLSNHINSFQEALKAIFISPFASYWYLHSLIIFSLIFYISSVVSHKFKLGRYNLLFTLILYSIIHYLLWELNFKYFFWVAGYLWLGYVYHSYLKSYQSNVLLVLLVIVLVIFSGGIIGFDFKRTLISVSVLFSLYYLFSKFDCKFLEFIGRNSLLIFLFHVYFLNIAKLLSSFFLSFDSSGVIYLLFSLILSIFGSILVGLIMDSLNISKYILGSNNSVK